MQLEAGKKTGEITLLCQTRKNTFYLRFFTKFWKQFSSNMASGWSDEFPGSSDEEDFFARSTVEEISQMKQDRQRWREQESLRNVDEEIDALINQQPQESASNSNIEVFADDGGEENGESSMRKSGGSISGQIYWVESM